MRKLLLFLLIPATFAVAQTDGDDALEPYRAGDYERAIRITTRELEANPNNIESHVVMGWSLNELGRYEEALDVGLRGLQISQFDHRLIQIVAEANLNLGHPLVALEYLELYVQVAPTGRWIAWIYHAMGEVFIELGEFHRADISLTTSVYHDSRNAVRWTRLGYAREQLEDWEEALTAYERALELSPDFGDAVRGRQRVRSQLGQ